LLKFIEIVLLKKYIKIEVGTFLYNIFFFNFEKFEYHKILVFIVLINILKCIIIYWKWLTISLTFYSVM